jgi:hypothetical protein
MSAGLPAARSKIGMRIKSTESICEAIVKSLNLTVTYGDNVMRFQIEYDKMPFSQWVCKRAQKDFHVL